MKRLLMIAVLLTFLLLVGCSKDNTSDYVDFTTGNTVKVGGTLDSNNNNSTTVDKKTLTDAECKVLTDLAVNDALKEKADNSEKQKPIEKLSTSDKFKKFMDEGWKTSDYSFNEEDCNNRLIKIAEDYFDNIEAVLDDDYSDDVNILNDDVDNVQNDINDYESDFYDIDFSGVNESVLNVTLWKNRISGYFNDTYNELNKITGYLDDAESALKNSDKFNRFENKINDAIDRVDRQYANSYNDVLSELKDLKDELNTHDYNDETDDVGNVYDDLDSYENELDDVVTDRAKDIRDKAQDLIDQFDDSNKVIRELKVICN